MITENGVETAFIAADDKAVVLAGDYLNKLSGEAIERHLAEHRIRAVFETVAIDGRPDGKVFEEYVEDNGIDLLVMGGYRHSRLNELIWGGVTSTVINRPPCWVMLSH